MNTVPQECPECGEKLETFDLGLYEDRHIITVKCLECGFEKNYMVDKQ